MKEDIVASTGGFDGIAPGPSTSKRHPKHKVYPYLLRDEVVERPNQVWCSDER